MGQINPTSQLGAEIYYTINKGESGGRMGGGDAAAGHRAELQRASAGGLYWNMQGIRVIYQKSLRL